MSKRKPILHGGRILSKKPKHSTPLIGLRLNLEEEKITNTLGAIHYIKSIFPHKKLGERFPPIVFKHQLYSLLGNRTDVDKDIHNLAENGVIKIFYLQHHNEEYMIMLTDDFTNYIRKIYESSAAKIGMQGQSNEKKIDMYPRSIVSRFLVEVVPASSDISISEDSFKSKFGFKDKDLTELVNSGLITLQDAGSWWFSFPGAGQFVKMFHKGRQIALRMIRMTNYKEILLSELKSRKSPASMKLGILYHVYDLVGSDLVKCIESSSGLLLRIIEE